MVQARSAGEIRSLNSIRGIAALAVAVYHAPALFGVVKTLPHAYLAVDLFFLLSGFVMFHVYDGRIAQGLTLARFAQVRLARLYPLLALATVASLVLWLAKVATGKVDFNMLTLAAAPLNLLLIPASSGASADHAAYPLLVQGWSLVWEILLCLGLFLWARHVRRGAGLIAVLAAVALALTAVHNGSLDGGWTTSTVWVGGLRALFGFAAGVAVRQAITEGRGSRTLSLAAMASGAVIVAYVAVIGRTLWAADLVIVVLGFPLVLAAACRSRSLLLENRIGDRLGEASYSVYLLHGLTLDVAVVALKALPQVSQGAHFAIGLAWVAILVAGSWISWRWVETPLRLFFSRPLPGAALKLRISRLVAPRPV